MSEKLIKDKNFINEVELKEYLSKKASSHYNYKYYSNKKYIDNILSDHSVYFSDGEKWNDKQDRDNLKSGETEYVRYCLCLSYSRSESVAMWLLYSGNNGCMIDYNKKIISAILGSTSIEAGYFDKDKFEPIKTIVKPDFSIEILDVIYYGNSKKHEDSYYVKRSDESNDNFNKSIIEKLSYQKKKLSWSYENECRIVISIKRTELDEDCKNIRIMLPSSLFDELKERVYDSPNSSFQHYKSSALKEDLNWNLCQNCSVKEVKQNVSNQM